VTTADDQGFTLLEVLVAFIIMSIILVPLLQGGSASVRNVEIASQTELAVSLARSHLSAFDTQPASAEEDLQGDENGYHWRLQVVPLSAMTVPVVGRSTPDSTVLYQVAVTISWVSDQRQSSIRLETRRLTPTPPTPQ
jgi:general secretion pathway protein I